MTLIKFIVVLFTLPFVVVGMLAAFVYRSIIAGWALMTEFLTVLKYHS